MKFLEGSISLRPTVGNELPSPSPQEPEDEEEEENIAPMFGTFLFTLRCFMIRKNNQQKKTLGARHRSKLRNRK
jgi:hypothetical protein